MKPEPSLNLADALNAVLLFFSPSPWVEAKVREWQRITGSTEATTKVLADHIRLVLEPRERPPSTYTFHEKLEAIRREIKLREFVYPNRIGARKMSQKKADFEIGIMKSIAEDYARAALREQAPAPTKSKTAQTKTEKLL